MNSKPTWLCNILELQLIYFDLFKQFLAKLFLPQACFLVGPDEPDLITLI